MSLDTNESLDREQARQQRADDMAAEEGADWQGRFLPGSFGCHELLDRVARTADQIERQIIDHPACIANAQWYGLAEDAAAALHELYRRIGAVHLDADAGRSPGRGR